MPDLQLPNLNLADCPPVAHLDQYAGAWCIEPKAARSLIRTVNNVNLAVHVAQNQPQAERDAQDLRAAAYETVDSSAQGSTYAIVRVEGLMTKHGSSMSRGGSTVRARRQLRAAAGDDRVKGILLILDTPGGTVSGTVDLALEVRSAAQSKPVYAFCEDMCCSGGYFVASQATRVYANSNAIVGSIGVYLVLEDWSKAFEEQGVAVHVVKFGDFKGAGAIGTAVTEEILEEDQKLVDAHGEQFVEFVQKGRKLTKAKARELADGRVYVGQEAVDVGLVDQIQTLDRALADLMRHKPEKAGSRAEQSGDPLLQVTADADAGEHDSPPEDVVSSTTTTEEEDAMSTKPAETTANAVTEPQAATYAQIAASCKGFDEDSGDDAKFAASCLKRELTIDQCKDEWAETLAARIEAREQELSAARKGAEASKTAKPAGNKPLEDGDGDTAQASTAGDPIAEWEAAVEANVAKGMSRRQASSVANRQHPGLREASVAAYNQQRKSA